MSSQFSQKCLPPRRLEEQLALKLSDESIRPEHSKYDPVAVIALALSNTIVLSSKCKAACDALALLRNASPEQQSSRSQYDNKRLVLAVGCVAFAFQSSRRDRAISGTAQAQAMIGEASS